MARAAAGDDDEAAESTLAGAAHARRRPRRDHRGARQDAVRPSLTTRQYQPFVKAGSANAPGRTPTSGTFNSWLKFGDEHGMEDLAAAIC